MSGTTRGLRRLAMPVLAVLIGAGASLLPTATNAARPGVPVTPDRGGVVVAWGSNDWGQTTLPTSLNGETVTAVSAGEMHSLALTADGRVIGWGDKHDWWGAAEVPASLAGKTVTAIAAGGFHSLALTSDGTVTGWGYDGDGAASVPGSLAGKTVTAIAAGLAHSMALTSEGTIISWGFDGYDQRDVPPSLAAKTVTAIAAGEQHSVALTADGVTVWGYNNVGQQNIPASLTGKTVTAIAAGTYHSLALASDGTFAAWGDNGAGQATIPPGLAGGTITAFAGGRHHSLALTADGVVTAWGDNSEGQATVPPDLAGKTVTAIAGGGTHSLAVVAALVPDHAPVVAGTASVGRTLTVTPGSYNATPDTLGYRWLRDGVPIAGATTGSYTLTSNDLGADITVEVTATKAGYVDAVDTSDPVGPVARGALSAPTASITGTAQVGQTLTAAPTGGYGYRWFRNDAPIPGAHGATYLLTADDLDAVIAVEVTASSPGYPDAADVSDPVGPVAPGSFATGPIASITGTVKVGHTLSAGTGTTMPAADRFGYQWFADGHPIAGATGPTHTLTAGQVRTVITVQVTASLAGYQDAVDVSEPTAPVATDRAPQLTLAADVDRLRRGQSATLTWTSLDAASISPGGAWPGSSGGGDMPLSGTATVEPRSLGAHTYLLTATNDNGTTTARVTIVVGREATDLTVQAPGSRRRGATFRVRARGLDAGEVFTIRFAGRAVAAGRADERGHVTRRVTVPMTTPLGMTRVRVIGSRPDRDGQDLLRVLPDRGH